MGPHGERLALEVELARGLRIDRVAHEAERGVTEQDLAGLSGLFQARRHVHRVAGHEGLAGGRVAGHHLAGVDAGAQLDAQAVVALEVLVPGRERVAHLGGRAHGAEGVVLVDRRHAEDGHHRIADEFLDRAAVALQDLLHRGERAAEDPAHRFRVEMLPDGGGAGDVAEEDRDGLADLARLPGVGRGAQRRAAAAAEAEAFRVRATTGRARGHAGEFRAYAAPLSCRLTDRASWPALDAVGPASAFSIARRSCCSSRRICDCSSVATRRFAGWSARTRSIMPRTGRWTGTSRKRAQRTSMRGSSACSIAAWM